ncbi:hypothetical protein VSR68_11280 [Paraburkholderia phymatum]|uniref:hypothetical protein n=1 Tax=Paraburkholderia phymatum TaxID=148447 RepID=UPI00316FCF48
MAGNKKPRKAYRPRPVRTDIATFMFEGDAQLDATLQTSILTAVHAAATSLVRGANDESAWHTIVNAFNIAQILSETAGNREVGLNVMYAAQNAMIGIGERANETGRLVFTGEELKAMNAGVALFEQFAQTVSKRQYAAAAGESVRRVRVGTVVKLRRAGETKRFALLETA